MITFFFVVFSLQQTTWKASSSVIDDGYSKQMFREENQLCFSTAGFTAKLYRGGKATGVETHMKILTAQILLAYPRMTANKQSRTAQLGEIGIWPQIEAFSQKSTPTPACVCCNKTYQPGASPPLYQGNFCFICLYYWLLMFFERKVNSCAFNGVAELLVQ